jgi:glycosyltransferase involved in cell wall biosynthesis
MRTSTLCAIVKNEGPYLLEWIAYHKSLGFDNILIYDNDSTDGSNVVLNRLAELGVVQVVKWPTTNDASPQISAYNDAVLKAKTEWICFLDADEFLNLHCDANLNKFLDRWAAEVSAVAINWRVFGSGGLKHRQKTTVIESFPLASVGHHHLNRHCKTFARVDAIDKMHIHRCFLRYGRYVDADGIDVEIERMGFTPSVKHSVVQINHYIVKSYEEFLEKRMRGNANRPLGAVDKYTTRDGDYFERHDRNEEMDCSIQKWLPILKAEVERLQSLL